MLFPHRRIAERTAAETSWPHSEQLWSGLKSQDSVVAAIGFLTTVTVCVFGRSTSFDFVGWDDVIHVYGNPHFREFRLAELGFFWLHPYEQLYVPLAYTLFGLLTFIAHRPNDYQALTACGAPLDPHVFHTANLFLHLFNVSLVFLLLRRIVRQDLPSLIGTTIFALHPLQVESVIWVSELRGLLATSFTLAALHAYVSSLDRLPEGTTGASRTWYILSLSAALCAMLSKPSSLVIGLLTAITGLWFRDRTIKQAAVDASPFLAIGVLLVVVTSKAQGLPFEQTVPLWQRPFVAGDALSFYLWKFAAPFNLTIDYSRKPVWVLSHWWTYLMWLIPASLAAIAGLLRHRAPYLGFGLAFAFVSLLPVLGFASFVFQQFSTTADRYAYVPMVGASFIAAFVYSHTRSNGRLIANCFLLVWLAALSFLSYRQTLVWRDDYSLYGQAVTANPQSVVGQYNLAAILENKGMLPEAAEHYRNAVGLMPDTPEFLVSLARVYAKMDEDASAEKALRDAIAVNASCEEAHRNLGILLVSEGRMQEGIAELKTALGIEPTDSIAIQRLGLAFVDLKDEESAIQTFQIGVRLRPADEALWNDLGLSLYSSRRPADAAAALAHALQLDPADRAARAMLSTLQ